jgi:hypothetical protein
VDAPTTQLDEEEQDSRCSAIVSTVKKSSASMRCACARRNPRQGESASRAGRADPGLADDLPHGRGGDCDAEAVRFADDPLVAQRGFSRARQTTISRPMSGTGA